MSFQQASGTAARHHGEVGLSVPATQSAVLTPDCANIWFCGTVQASPTLASCSKGKNAHWVRGTTKSLPPAPPPPGPPPPPPPPGNAVQELSQFATSACDGPEGLHGTWRYGACSSLYPSRVPTNVTSKIGSVKAALSATAPHTAVTFTLYGDASCSTPLPPSVWKNTLTVNLNTCAASEPPQTYSLFQGHQLPLPPSPLAP